MPRVTLHWTENALQRVREAYRFYAVDCDNKEAAKAAVETIRRQAKNLSRFPDAGRPADDLAPEQRELIIPFGSTGYVLIYEVWGDVVLILSVKHQREAGYQFPA